MGQSWSRLADYLRAELGMREWTQAELANRAGVHVDTVNDLLSGSSHRKRFPPSLAKIEHALGWQPGSARSVLDGAEPTRKTWAAARYDDGGEALRSLREHHEGPLTTVPHGERQATDDAWRLADEARRRLADDDARRRLADDDARRHAMGTDDPWTALETLRILRNEVVHNRTFSSAKRLELIRLLANVEAQITEAAQEAIERDKSETG